MLNVSFSTGTIFKVMSHMKTMYYGDHDCTVEDISEQYTQVAQEMLNLPSLPGCENYTIQLKQVTDDGETYIDTCMQSETGEYYSMSYTDWAELMDLRVVTETQIELLEQLAHILWELTFHGFSREDINKSRAELIATMDEAKQDDATLITWDELKSEFKNLK